MSSTNKVVLRRSLLQTRLSLSPTQWRAKSDRICEQLKSFPLYTEAKTILAYFSFRQEPDLSLLFESKNNQHIFGFPRCVGQSLMWHLWQPEAKLVEGKFGILEPSSDAPTISASEVDLILVPAVAGDRQGYRLGYGGGFYDRLLTSPQWKNIPTVGIVFEFAYLPTLPIDPWDTKLKYICTEEDVHDVSTQD